jgi:hypothetical protein
MQMGRGGMGSHKHGISGHVGPSPRTKYMRALEDNRFRESIKKPRAKLKYESVSEAVRDFKPK